MWAQNGTIASRIGMWRMSLVLRATPRGTGQRKSHRWAVASELLAEWTGLEPATPGVTGRYSNQLNYHSAAFDRKPGSITRHLRRQTAAAPSSASSRCPASLASNSISIARSARLRRRCRLRLHRLRRRLRAPRQRLPVGGEHDQLRTPVGRVALAAQPLLVLHAVDQHREVRRRQPQRARQLLGRRCRHWPAAASAARTRPCAG